MATEAVIRPHVDQENANPLNIKGGNVSGMFFNFLTFGLFFSFYKIIGREIEKQTRMGKCTNHRRISKIKLQGKLNTNSYSLG